MRVRNCRSDLAADALIAYKFRLRKKKSAPVAAVRPIWWYDGRLVFESFRRWIARNSIFVHRSHQLTISWENKFSNTSKRPLLEIRTKIFHDSRQSCDERVSRARELCLIPRLLVEQKTIPVPRYRVTGMFYTITSWNPGPQPDWHPARAAGEGGENLPEACHRQGQFFGIWVTNRPIYFLLSVFISWEFIVWKRVNFPGHCFGFWKEDTHFPLEKSTGEPGKRARRHFRTSKQCSRLFPVVFSINMTAH